MLLKTPQRENQKKRKKTATETTTDWNFTENV
jgi:hypothetical protein